MKWKMMLSTTLLTVLSAQAGRVYFGTGADGIYTALFNPETGRVTEIKQAAEIHRPGFVAIHPEKPVLYSIARPKDRKAEGVVAAFQILEDGNLKEMNRMGTGGPGACHVILDPAGKTVLVANYAGGSACSFQVLKNGALSERRSFFQHEGQGEMQKRQEAPHAHSVYTNPEGTFAYVPDLGIDKVMIYQLDHTDGKMIPAGFAKVPGGSMGPRHMKWSADGKWAYVLNELDLSISVYKPGKKPGSMEFIETKSVLSEHADREKLSCAEIRIHPNGKFIYASIRDLDGRGRDAISVFRPDESGINRLKNFPTEVWFPRNFNLDPSGNWMLVGGLKSNELAVFKVDPKTGLLAHQETVPFDPGPICIEFVND